MPSLELGITEKPSAAQTHAFCTLIDVQFWLMGPDVDHPSGNVLCRLGFSREPPPPATAGPDASSRYRLASRAQDGDVGAADITIWPCGMLVQTAQQSCVIVRGLPPAIVTDIALAETYDSTVVVDAWRQGTPGTVRPMIMVCRWFLHYERDVLALVGIDDRTPRTGTSPALAPLTPCSLYQQWNDLAVSLTT